ncbi:MAG TPA: hypothetical protein GX707_15130 [Epulopiscium sp.]|nr:hypothetical protein [Candidatus Epulonipiscium sp.]
MLDKEVDITGTLRVIEKLKSQILMDVAQLFTELNEPNRNSTIERGDLLADIVILSYLLSKQLGIPYQQIDRRIINKTRTGLVESNQNDRWHKDLAGLLQHFELLE